MNHCVLYRTNLKYDGRVSAIVRTLAIAYPKDVIHIFEYPETTEYCTNLPENIKIIKCSFFLDRFKKSSLIQILKVVEYGIRSFYFLIKNKPKSIQVHHETVILGAFVYKIIFKNVKIVYDDKELYHLRDKNIPKLLYWMEYYMIEKSNLVITCNNYRTKALKFIHKNRLNTTIIIDNYVFKDNKEKKLSSNLIEEINILKNNNKKILLHQGIISENRGEKLLSEISNNLPEQWIMIFIGVEDSIYNNFAKSIPSENHKNIYNLGFVAYNELNSLYKLVDACVLFYDSNTFNNNYCAPNRLYSAINSGRPIIVNQNNGTLYNFVQTHQNGVCYSSSASVMVFFEKYHEYFIKSKFFINKYEYNLFIPSLLNFYTSKI